MFNFRRFYFHKLCLTRENAKFHPPSTPPPPKIPLYGLFKRCGPSLPVERVVLHPEVVAGKIASGVSQVVELVPEKPLGSGRCGDDGHLHRKVHGGEEGLTRHGGLGRGRGGGGGTGGGGWEW